MYWNFRVKIDTDPHYLKAAPTAMLQPIFEHQLLYPTEVTLTIKRPDIVIWSLK